MAPPKKYLWRNAAIEPIEFKYDVSKRPEAFSKFDVLHAPEAGPSGPNPNNLNSGRRKKPAGRIIQITENMTVSTSTG